MPEVKPPLSIKTTFGQGIFEAQAGSITALAGTARTAAHLVAKRYFEKGPFELLELTAGQSPGQWIAKAEANGELF
jgi:hypothetical protein